MLAIRKLQSLARSNGHSSISNTHLDTTSHYSSQSSLQSSNKLTCSQTSLQSAGSACTNASSNTNSSLYLPLIQAYGPASSNSGIQKVAINTRRVTVGKSTQASPDGAQPPLTSNGLTPNTPELKTFQQLPSSNQSISQQTQQPAQTQTHAQFEPIYVSKGQLVHPNAAQMPVTQVLYTASGQPVYASLPAQPLYHTPVYASQSIYGTTTGIAHQFVQPIYSNGSPNTDHYSYESDHNSSNGNGTLGRPKNVCKTRPIAKVAAKTREDYTQHVIQAPEKQTFDSNEVSLSNNADKVMTNNYLNHLQNSQYINTHQQHQHQMINAQQPQQQIIYADQTALQNSNVYSQLPYHVQQQQQQVLSQSQLPNGVVYTSPPQITPQQQLMQQQLHLQLQQMHLPIDSQQQQPQAIQQLNNSYIYATLKRKKLPPPIPKRTNSMRSGCSTAPTTPLLPPDNSSPQMVLQRRGSLDDCSQINALVPLSLPPATVNLMDDRDLMQEQVFATCVKSLTTRFSMNAKAIEQAHEASVAATVVASTASTTITTSATPKTALPPSANVAPVPSADGNKSGEKTNDDKLTNSVIENATLRRNAKDVVRGTTQQLQRISSGSSNCSSSLSTLCSSSGVSSLSSGASNCESGSCESSLNGQSRTPSATSSECIASQTSTSETIALPPADCAEDFPPPPSPSVLPVDAGSESSGPSSLEALPPPPPPPSSLNTAFLSHSLPPPPPPLSSINMSTSCSTTGSHNVIPQANVTPAAQVLPTKNNHFVNPSMMTGPASSPCVHSECCVSSSSSTDSMPFANDNIGTLRAKPDCSSNLCYQRQMAMFATGSESSGSFTGSISSGSSSSNTSSSSSAAQTPMSPAKQVSWPCSPVKQLLPIELVPNVNQSKSHEANQQVPFNLQPKPEVPIRACSIKADASQVPVTNTYSTSAPSASSSSSLSSLPVKIASVAPHSVVINRQSSNLIVNQKPVLKSLPLTAASSFASAPTSQPLVNQTKAIVHSSPSGHGTSQNG